MDKNKKETKTDKDYCLIVSPWLGKKAVGNCSIYIRHKCKNCEFYYNNLKKCTECNRRKITEYQTICSDCSSSIEYDQMIERKNKYFEDRENKVLINFHTKTFDKKFIKELKKFFGKEMIIGIQKSNISNSKYFSVYKKDQLIFDLRISDHKNEGFDNDMSDSSDFDFINDNEFDNKYLKINDIINKLKKEY